MTKSQLDLLDKSNPKCKYSCEYVHVDDKEKQDICLEHCLNLHKEYYKLENVSSICALASIVLLSFCALYYYKTKHGS